MPIYAIDIQFYDSTECSIHKKFVFTEKDGVYTHVVEKSSGAMHTYYFYDRKEIREWINTLWDTGRIVH